MSILTLNSYEILLGKCKKEIGELRKCNSHPDYDFLLFNVILSMNHLFEWFLKDDSVSQDKKLECIKSFNPYSERGKVSRDFTSLYGQLEDFPKTKLSYDNCI